MTLYSFDIFDTLITRTTATPRGIFGLMQECLKTDSNYAKIDPHIRENFYSLRIGAEQLARRIYQVGGCEEITLEQIYEVLGMTGCIDGKEAEQLMALERKTEISNICGIPNNINKVLALKGQGERVVLISDMYLDKPTVLRMLEKADSRLTDLPIYLSSEQKKAKGGSLFLEVAIREKVRFDEWVHYGDNPHVDVRIPEQFGIQARQLPAKDLLPFEKKILDDKGVDGNLQFTIGASANARLFGEKNTLAYRYGTSLGGCIAYPYVWWVLEQAGKKGIRQLYFIARDGYLLKEIADEIIRKCELPLQTTYIYGSRKAWRLAGLSEKNWNIPLLVQWSTPDQITSISRLAEVFEMKEEELRSYLPEEQKKSGDLLSFSKLVQTAKYLDENGQFKKKVLEQNYEKRLLVLDYLRQEIDITRQDYAFVELIGSGYTQLALSGLMEELTEAPVRTFFYHLDARLNAQSCIFYNFFPENIQNAGVMEILFSAPHGHTLGYARTADGRVQPILDREQEYLQAYGMEDFQEGVRDFVREYHKVSDRREAKPGMLALSLFYRRYMAVNADPDLLEYLGDMPFASRGEDIRPYSYAPVLTEDMIRNIYLIRTDEPLKLFYPGTNFDLSLQRCTAADRELIQKYSKMRGTEEAKRIREEYYRKHGIVRKPGGIYNFPIEILKQRIAIYGAGKFGKALYKELSSLGDKQVAQWVDREAARCSAEGWPVKPIETLDPAKFDQVVIAILNLQTARAVKVELILRGIPEDKILLNDFRTEW